MTSLATLVLNRFIVLTLCCVPTAVGLSDEITLPRVSGNEVGKANREVGRKVPPPVVRAALMQAVQKGAVPWQKVEQHFNERLRAYGSVSAAWIVKLCALSDQQQGKLKEIVEGRLVDGIAKFANSKDPNRYNRMLPEAMPLLFTMPTGPAIDFTEQFMAAIKKDLLTEEQTHQLETALVEREVFRNQAYLTYIISIVDQELFLTSRQHEVLLSQHESQKTTLRHPLYTFSPQDHCMPYESVVTILKASEGNSFLELSQEKRLQDLNGNQPNSGHLMLNSALGPEKWERQIVDTGQQQLEKFLRAAAVRVDYYKNELQLTAEQADHVNVASKGAGVRALANWKDQALQTMDRLQQRLPQIAQEAQLKVNFGFGVPPMDMNSIDQDEIWTDAVSSVTAGMSLELSKQRLEWNRTATAQALLAMYDSELWLTPDQREPLSKLILQTLPSGSSPITKRPYIRDLVLVTYPLFKTTEKQKTDVLSEPQQHVWKQMESCFQYQKQSNQVDIPLRNRGGSFSFILKE